MDSYQAFISYPNFYLAYQRIRTSQSDLIKNIIRPDMEIFATDLEKNINSLLAEILSGAYNPGPCYKIYVPKKDLLARPLSALAFADVLVYQALVNIIAAKVYPVISQRYGKELFGNILTSPQAHFGTQKFLYHSWKVWWKKFNLLSKQYFSEGYHIIAEFDIASFYDTIDHKILETLLITKYEVDPRIASLLIHCLTHWTTDASLAGIKSSHGIPQGLSASAILGELYLLYLDEKILDQRKYDFHYVRYVDDIRIFTRDEKTSQKLMIALDIFSRDLGLIPQSGKSDVRKIDDIDKELKLQYSKFSYISKIYKSETKDKPAKSLDDKNHALLKRRLLQCFIKDTEEIFLDKTVIRFALFRLNADVEVRDLLLSQYENIIPHFEAILFYLQKHFAHTEEVMDFLLRVMSDENILYHHFVALCFRFFPHFPYDEKIYLRYADEKNRYWLVNYEMIPWLYYHKKYSLLEKHPPVTHYFINRRLIEYQYLIAEQNNQGREFAMNLCKSEVAVIARQGRKLLSHYGPDSTGKKI